MVYLWAETALGEDEEAKRIYQMRRRVYLGTVFLVSLVNFTTVLAAERAVMPLWLNAFNFVMCGYAIGLLVYASFWFWKSRKYGKKQSGSALRDALTGLPNWTGLSHWLRSREAATAGREGPTSLVYVDLTGLERINAERGQPTGDGVLRETAMLLEREVPNGSIVGRVGGDEFLVIMRGAEIEEAKRLADRVALKIKTHSFGADKEGRFRLRARTELIPNIAKGDTLSELIASARAREAGPGSTAEAGEEGGGCYSVPQVTLGACARYRLDRLDVPTRNELTVWQRDFGKEFLDRMANDLADLASLKAESRPFDFVTPVPALLEREEAQGRQRLAEQVASLLDVPYRIVLSASSFATAVRRMEPQVAAPIEKGAYVLLVSDVIESYAGIRRCVQKLAEAGAFVQVVAWAAG